MEEAFNQDVLLEIDSQGVATLTLNRIEKHNAFDDQLITTLIRHLKSLAHNDSIRCLVLTANGKHFSSGADLHWMRSMASKSPTANLADAKQLAQLMSNLDQFPHPTLAVIHGCAFGGALGLICCCDITIAEPSAQFCFSEVKLGLIPATIGPYVCRAIGIRQARRYMLTAERIPSNEAHSLGLIHHLVEDTEVVLNQQVTQILSNSPNALTLAKQLCQLCESGVIDHDIVNQTSKMIADIRASCEGQEGLNAYFERRSPSWIVKSPSDEGGNNEDNSHE
ncbi:enoyl-CoA hydratase-related protein [Vibrio makurazakiensis]|uniref:enoyl-CoA hydratase-related protein n=1 Tax=Vibrio makurazakiensis TaxID=2910250 RepID=UPI003D0B5601